MSINSLNLPLEKTELNNSDGGEEIYEQVSFIPIDVEYLPYDERIELDCSRLHKSTIVRSPDFQLGTSFFCHQYD